MNWFAWIVIAVGAALALTLLRDLVAPRRRGVSIKGGGRERDMGEAMYRNGQHGRPWDGKLDGP